MERKIMRGDMYYADLSPVVGSEQDGLRPVVAIQNNIGNKYSPTIVVAAVTSKTTLKMMLPTHIRISTKYGIEKDSAVLLEQIRTIDRKRLVKFIGALDEDIMVKINRALAISIGLIKHPFSKTENQKATIMFCLCPVCASRFYDLPDHRIRRLNYKQVNKDKCDYCNYHGALDFLVTHTQKNRRKN